MTIVPAFNKGPLVVKEELVSLFKFFFQQEIYDGMRYRQDLFRLLNTFEVARRERVYNLGHALADRGLRVVITRSRDRYKLWINLRDPWERKNDKTEIVRRANCYACEQFLPT